MPRASKQQHTILLTTHSILGGSSNSGSSSKSSSSGGFFGGRSATRQAPAPAAPARAPVMHNQAHPPAQHAPSGGGMMSGIGGAVVTGMAMGTGSEIAHQAIRGMMGSGSSGHGQQAPAQQTQQAGAPVQYAQQSYEQQQEQNPCSGFNTSFLSCLKDYSGSINMCQMNMDSLMQCEKDNARFFSSM